MTKYVQMTKKQLAGIVECYSDVFPAWKSIGGNRLVRVCFPVLQQIGFETLRSGGYRPSAGIRILPFPSIGMLQQFLDVKHRQIELREHPSVWNSVVVAMEQQFLPPVRKSIDIWEVKSLCEQAAREKTSDLTMLAILNAYLGQTEQAISYCQQIQVLPPLRSGPRPHWELEHQEFCSKLLKAVEDKCEQQFLEDAVPQEYMKIWKG